LRLPGLKVPGDKQAGMPALSGIRLCSLNNVLVAACLQNGIESYWLRRRLDFQSRFDAKPHLLLEIANVNNRYRHILQPRLEDADDLLDLPLHSHLIRRASNADAGKIRQSICCQRMAEFFIFFRQSIENPSRIAGLTCVDGLSSVKQPFEIASDGLLQLEQALRARGRRLVRCARFVVK